MDEPRVQAYLSLIQELLDCPSGEGQTAIAQSLINVFCNDEVRVDASD